MKEHNVEIFFDAKSHKNTFPVNLSLLYRKVEMKKGIFKVLINQ